jgi:hypothetical protein
VRRATARLPRALHIAVRQNPILVNRCILVCVVSGALLQGPDSGENRDPGRAVNWTLD